MALLWWRRSPWSRRPYSPVFEPDFAQVVDLHHLRGERRREEQPANAHLRPLPRSTPTFSRWLVASKSSLMPSWVKLSMRSWLRGI